MFLTTQGRKLTSRCQSCPSFGRLPFAHKSDTSCTLQLRIRHQLWQRDEQARRWSDIDRITSHILPRAHKGEGLCNGPDLTDMLHALLLSEGVYLGVDVGEATAAEAIGKLQAEMLPSHLTRLHAVQWSKPHVNQRYLLAESADVLFVAIMGTKFKLDLVTNANVFMEPIWPELSQSQVAAAHRGYLGRSREIPIEQIHQHALQRGKRLVLCGHSLGGAVASLCALRLLDLLPQNLHHTVTAIGFASPAFGNAGLAAHVEAAGWAPRFTNYLLPEDPVPHILSALEQPPAVAQKATLRSLSDSSLDIRATERAIQIASAMPVQGSDLQQDFPSPLEENKRCKAATADSIISITASAGVFRSGADVMSNVQPFRRKHQRPFCNSQPYSPLPRVLNDNNFRVQVNASTTVLPVRIRGFDSPTPLPDMAQSESAQEGGATGGDSSSPEPTLWPAIALSRAQKSLRLAQRIKDAPWDAYKAVRTVFVPFGQQVWLPHSQLSSSLASAVGTESEAALQASVSFVMESDGRTPSLVDTTPLPVQGGSILCPASHRVPSYRARVMQLLGTQIGSAAGPKLYLSNGIAPVLEPLVATLASCTAMLEGVASEAAALERRTSVLFSTAFIHPAFAIVWAAFVACAAWLHRVLLRDPTGNEPPLPGDDDVKVSIMVKGHGLHICNLAQAVDVRTGEVFSATVTWPGESIAQTLLQKISLAVEEPFHGKLAWQSERQSSSVEKSVEHMLVNVVMPRALAQASKCRGGSAMLLQLKSDWHSIEMEIQK